MPKGKKPSNPKMPMKGTMPSKGKIELNMVPSPTLNRKMMPPATLKQMMKAQKMPPGMPPAGMPPKGMPAWAGKAMKPSKPAPKRKK